MPIEKHEAEIKQFLSLAGELAVQEKEQDLWKITSAAHRLINRIFDDPDMEKKGKLSAINKIVDEIPGLLKGRIKEIMKNFITDDEIEAMKCFGELVTIKDMAVFKVGTHNGDKYTDKAIKQIVDNFKKLFNKIRPKLKITHKETQEKLAGLASYGDITKVISKVINGVKHIYIDVANVPIEVAKWIKERRFPERSIEIYPKINVDGTDFLNVLRNVSLLGHEPPAVDGLAPVKLQDDNGVEYEVCIAGLNDNQGNKTEGEGGDEMPDAEKKVFEEQIAKLKKEIAEKDIKIADMTNEGDVKKLQGEKKDLADKLARIEEGQKDFEKSEKRAKDAEDEVTKMKKENKDKFIEDTIKGLKEKGKVLPRQEPAIKALMESLDVSEKLAYSIPTGDDKKGEEKVECNPLEAVKQMFEANPKVVDFKEISGDGETKPDTKEIKDTDGREVDGADVDAKAQKYMEEHKCTYEKALEAVSDTTDYAKEADK